MLEIPNDVVNHTLNSNLILSSDTICHIEQIRTCGNYILGMSSYDTDALFKVFSKNGKYIASFGKIGEGIDEFTHGVIPTYHYNDDYIYLQDVNKCCLYKVDLLESIQHNRTMCNQRYKTKPMTLNVCNSGDSILVYEHTSAHEYKLKQELINGIEVAEPISLNEPVEHLFASCYGKMVFNSQSKSVVKASIYEDRLIFLNYDNLTYKTFTHSSTQNEKNWIYYGAITSNDYGIYVLYSNQSVEDSFDIEKPMTIYIFDWQGNYTKTLKTNEYLVDIAVSKNNDYIYGLDMEGNVYEYYLNKI